MNKQDKKVKVKKLPYMGDYWNACTFRPSSKYKSSEKFILKPFNETQFIKPPRKSSKWKKEGRRLRKLIKTKNIKQEGDDSNER